MSRPIEEIVPDYNALRESFSNFRKRGDGNKGTLLEFEARFVELKADLRELKVEMTKNWTRRDDKAATAIKYRLAIAIHEGNYTTEDYGEDVSINQAEKFASGSEEYKKFVDQRAFYRESLTNVSDLRNDLDSYINLVKDMIKQ